MFLTFVWSIWDPSGSHFGHFLNRPAFPPPSCLAFVWWRFCVILIGTLAIQLLWVGACCYFQAFRFLQCSVAVLPFFTLAHGTITVSSEKSCEQLISAQFSVLMLGAMLASLESVHCAAGACVRKTDMTGMLLQFPQQPPQRKNDTFLFACLSFCIFVFLSSS